jgi:flagellar basal body-associated protein FliL
MKKFFFVFLASILSVTLIPGTAKAASSDPTVYPVVCVSSGWTDVYLEYGVNSVTITNPSGCDVSQSFYLSDGAFSTWDYSETIGGTTISKNYRSGFSFQTGSIGTLDSFTLTHTSTIPDYIVISGGAMNLRVYFNKQFGTLSPNPVEIGQEVTVTGTNLSSVTSLSFQDGSNVFRVTTANRTATQLTFTVPLTVFDFMSGATVNVIPGTYRLLYNQEVGKTLTITAAPTTTVPGAPTIGVVTAISPTSAAIAFLAPTSDGGATIETYTATSSPGSITGQVMQAGSGTISMTGLTSSTAYTFTVTASNSVGTSSASSATVSITTPASAEEIAAQNAAAKVAAASAAKADAVAAAVQREVDRTRARSEILRRYVNLESISMELFTQAGISGINKENFEEVQAEIATLPKDSRSDITQILKIARKFKVVGMIASARFSYVYPGALIEIGLISATSKFKTSLTAAVRKLPASERSSYVMIKAVIDKKMAEIQAREDRLTAVKARIAARRGV